MEELDFTEKTPREFDDEDATTGVGGDDIPIHVAAPMRGSELPALSRTRAARGTRTRITIPPPIPGHARRATTLPPPLPGGARRATTVPPLFSTTIAPSKLIPFLPPPDDDAPSGEIVASPPPPVAIPRAPSPLVIVAPLPPPFPRGPIAPPPPPMFEEPHRTAAPLAPLADLDVESDETDYFDRSEPPPKRNVAGLVGIAVGAIVVVVVLGLGLRGGSNAKVAATATPPARLEAVTPPAAVTPAVVPGPAPRVTVTAPAPAPTPPITAPSAPSAPPVAPTTRVAAEAQVAVETAPAARVTPETASLPITSEPSGAVVTLIADGNATIVGRTPVTAAIDPSHTYDVVVALRDHPTKVTHVDPRRTRSVSFDLVETPAAATEPAPAPTRRSTRSSTPTRSAAPKSLAAETPAANTEPPPTRATRKEAPAKTAAPKAVATASPAPKQPAVPAGSGVLMVSAKPPCEIAIDGKLTHLVTPQRSIALAPGTHSITLVNAQQKITKTFSVKIVAKQPTKLIQDFTQR